jgi:hypothetical protein
MLAAGPPARLGPLSTCQAREGMAALGQPPWGWGPPLPPPRGGGGPPRLGGSQAPCGASLSAKQGSGGGLPPTHAWTSKLAGPPFFLDPTPI